MTTDWRRRPPQPETAEERRVARRLRIGAIVAMAIIAVVLFGPHAANSTGVDVPDYICLFH